MSTELAKYGESMNITKETIKEYICQKASEQECLMFAEKCKLHKLNPFTGDAHLVKYSDKAPAQMIVTEQAWNRKLENIPGLLGVKDGLILKTKDGEVKEVEGEFYDDETLIGAWCKINIKDKDSVVGKIRLRDYDKDQAIWKTNKARMINKTCRVHTIRKGIPDMGGLYIEAEMDAVNGSQNKRIYNDNTVVIDADEVSKQKLESFQSEIQNANSLDQLEVIGRRIGEEITIEDDKSFLRGVYNDCKNLLS